MKFLEAEPDAIAQNGMVLPGFCRACRNCEHTLWGQAPGIAADFLDVVSKIHVKFLEAELDAIAQNRKVLPGFAEHVEIAGTHSRDKHLVLPPIS